MTRMIWLVLAGCLARASETPTLPPTPLRIGLAPISAREWKSDMPLPGDLRAMVATWLDHWHGVTIAPVAATDAALAAEIPQGPGSLALTLFTPLGPDDEALPETAARVCRAARATGVDAIVVGAVLFREVVSHACSRKSLGLFERERCLELSKTRIDHAEAELSVHFFVVSAASCGWTVLLLPFEKATSKQPEANRAQVWTAQRAQTRRVLPDVLHSAPRHAPPR